MTRDVPATCWEDVVAPVLAVHAPEWAPARRRRVAAALGEAIRAELPRRPVRIFRDGDEFLAALDDPTIFAVDLSGDGPDLKNADKIIEEYDGGPEE